MRVQYWCLRLRATLEGSWGCLAFLAGSRILMKQHLLKLDVYRSESNVGGQEAAWASDISSCLVFTHLSFASVLLDMSWNWWGSLWELMASSPQTDRHWPHMHAATLGLAHIMNHLNPQKESGAKK